MSILAKKRKNLILYITNADTEVLAIALVADELDPDLDPIKAIRFEDVTPQVLLDARIVIVRSLGGLRAIGDDLFGLLDEANSNGINVGVFSGESNFDPELASISNIDNATLLKAQTYLIAGGPDNFANLFYFLSDTLLMTGIGFESAQQIPDCGFLTGYDLDRGNAKNVVVYFYRAHMVSGNTKFIEEICDGLLDVGLNPVPIYAYSLRQPSIGQLVDFEPISLAGEFNPVAVIVTMLGAGSLNLETATWDASVTRALGVPVFQAIISSRSKAEFEASQVGLAPLDASWQIAIPEFDGRIVTVPVSFKEEIESDLGVTTAIYGYRCDLERVKRMSLLVARYVSLQEKANADKRIAIVLSAYPTKKSRLGNAVGLDTPESVIVLLRLLESIGYVVADFPNDGVELMESLSASYEYEDFRLSLSNLSATKNCLALNDYCAMFDLMEDHVREDLTDAWGPAPGAWYHDNEKFFFPGIWFGNVFVTIQPPRGFGENPIAIYHSPKLAPTHHYLAFYWWLQFGVDIDAVVHMGKHGTLEWLPGKAAGMSRSCYPDLILGSMPLIYPFVVNDPGEGTQAKRRTHAVIIDHMIPPLTRAESYNELHELESLLDLHARYSVLDPTKLPSIRQQVWELMQKINMHRDLSLEDSVFDFQEDEFDDVLLEIDGYLCEIKDATIRGGLHVLGKCHEGEALVDLIFALTRIDTFKYGSLHKAIATQLGLDPAVRRDSDQIANVARLAIERLILKESIQDSGAGSPEFGKNESMNTLGHEHFDLEHILSNEALLELCDKIANDLLPRLWDTPRELTAIANALNGEFIEPGPSGSPSRGSLEVLPTGRNFYAIDPSSLPTPTSFETGKLLGQALIEKYTRETNEYPKSVAIVVWGTAAMRTGGDDLAEALWLLGTRPIWDTETGKVVDIEVLPQKDLGRPRVDVTLRISGFFRDAFPNAIALFNKACDLVSKADPESLIVDSACEPRVFGPQLGAYGSGILSLLEAGNWRGDADIAEVYLAWSGYSYSANGFGIPARDELERRLLATQIAVKNQDNREHDIFDSDDYLQDHGGLLATIRSLTGSDAKAYFGDSSNPTAPQVRTLAQEAARVVRSRVLNPKWINAMMQHGYKGAFELSATVDYLFGYDATANVVMDWMYEEVTKAYLKDPQVREFLGKANPTAAAAIANRLMEAISRKLWSEPSDDSLGILTNEILSAEQKQEGKRL